MHFYNYFETLMILTEYGSSHLTTTSSLTLRPRIACANKHSLEILPLIGSASAEPTIV